MRRIFKGFPRIRARGRYHAADFRVGDGLRLRKSGKLGFVGVSGEVKVRWHRPLPSAPNSAMLTRQADKWYIVFHVEVVPVERAGPDSVGVDFGLSNLELVKVDPRGTSQTCPECGIVAAKPLAEREHRCECGCVLDRDVAAAKVVHFKAFGFWPGAGRGSTSERVAA